MKEGQQAIYYVIGDSYAAASNSPHLEIFRKKGIEVLIMYDRIDEWVVGTVTEFEGKPLRSVSKGALDLGELADAEEKKAQEAEAAALKPLLERLKKALGDRVKEVRVTHRLTDSPACLVVGEGELSGNLERLLRAAGQNAPEVVPVLEINPEHPLVKRLESEPDERIADWANLLLDEAMLSEGAQLPDPAAFVRRLNALVFGTKTE
jgi:molecular chaperone HtpG